MRKNNMLRIASVLLVAVLLSTCAISGVFARYFRNGTITENAQVAKWGVTITPNANDNTNDLFYTSYDLNAADATVASSATHALVAPGTTAAAWTPFTMGGQPEVDIQVDYTATLTLSGWEVDSAEYCPLVFTVNNGTTSTEYKIDGSEITTVAELKAAVEGAIASASANYEENQALGTAVKVPTVSWTWAYGADDAKDTALGDAAAADPATPATVELTINVHIFQID